VSKVAYKKLRIHVVDELHAIRQSLARASQDRILEEAKAVREKIARSKKKR
jgi:hypothetical protein